MRACRFAPSFQRLLRDEFNPPLEAYVAPGNKGRLVVPAATLNAWLEVSARGGRPQGKDVGVFFCEPCEPAESGLLAGHPAKHLYDTYLEPYASLARAPPSLLLLLPLPLFRLFTGAAGVPVRRRAQR